MSYGYYALDIPVARAMVGEHITVNKRIKLKKVDTRKLREGLGLNQSEFWERLEVTQSGGSRYENGRAMPRPVRRLLGLMYLKERL